MSKQSIDILSLTYKAKGAVASYRLVGFDGAQVAVRGGKVLGSAMRPAFNNEYSDVRVLGTATVELGGLAAQGDRLIADANGRAIPFDPAAATAATDAVFGRTLELGSAGEFVEVLLGR